MAKTVQRHTVKKGRFYSVWERRSTRCAWICVESFVLVTRVEQDPVLGMDVSWQTGSGGGATTTGWTATYVDGKTRKLDAPVFDVPLLVSP